MMNKKYLLLATTAMIAGITSNAMADSSIVDANVEKATIGVTANIVHVCGMGEYDPINFGSIYMTESGGELTMNPDTGVITATNTTGIYKYDTDGETGALSGGCDPAHIVFDGCVDGGDEQYPNTPETGQGCPVGNSYHYLKPTKSGSASYVSFGGTLYLNDSGDSGAGNFEDAPTFKVKVQY